MNLDENYFNFNFFSLKKWSESMNDTDGYLARKNNSTISWIGPTSFKYKYLKQYFNIDNEVNIIDNFYLLIT